MRLAGRANEPRRPPGSRRWRIGGSWSATDPPFGNRGEQAKAVTITGNGFEPGAVAEWQRNGAADPKIQVLSTQYVSATKVVATINIAGDATVALYSVAITNPNRKRGIGTEKFEVTQAVLVPGMEFAYRHQRQR